MYMETPRVANEKVNRSVENLAVDVDKLMMGEVEHTDSNDMQLIEIGIIRHL